MSTSQLNSDSPSEYSIPTNIFLVKLRQNLSGFALSHTELDNNWEVLRRTLNSLIVEVDELTTGTLANTTTSNLYVNKLADNCVTSSKIQNGAITSSHFSTNVTLPSTTVVNTTNITNSAVTTDKIADGAVTNAKVTDVSGAKITNGTITADKFASGALPDAPTWSSLTGAPSVVTGISISGNTLSWTLESGGGTWAIGTATATTLGLVKGGGDVDVETDGALSIGAGVITANMLETTTYQTLSSGPWQSSNVNFLSNHHIPGGGGTSFSVNIHTSLPNAVEVCIEVICNEQNLQYWNVFTNTWELIINVGNNVYGGTRVCIPLGPGNVGAYASYINNIVIPDIINPGIIKLHGVGADGNGGHIYNFRAVYWR